MKTICIYHSVDLDGWMSAAIVKHWYQQNYKELYSLEFLGWNYGNAIPDLSEYDKVIMCDISFPKEEMYKLCEKRSDNYPDFDFVYIDHHISAINDLEKAIKNSGTYTDYPDGLRDTKFAACELTWTYFFPDDEIPEIVRLLGRYDCFGHKGTDEEKYVLEFQYGARQVISNYEDAYNCLIDDIEHMERYTKNSTIEPRKSKIHYHIIEKGVSIYGYLCTEAKQVYKNGFEIVLKEPFVGQWGSGKDDRKFICFNKERFNPINFGIDYHADGYDGAACFWYDGKQWAFSLYNDNGEVDCSIIAKSFNGGGHKGASGFKINNIEEFLNGSR